MADIPVTPEQHETEERKPLHGAILNIDLRAFADLIDLPKDVHITGIYHNPLTAGLVVHLTGDSLPEIGKSMIPADADVQIQQKLDDDGVWWRRIGFHIYR